MSIETHTKILTAEIRGMRIELSDEAAGYGRWGEPEGWVMFCEVQGEHLTVGELRELTDEMERLARATGKEGRHDV
jgi:hypothetical protein